MVMMMAVMVMVIIVAVTVIITIPARWKIGYVKVKASRDFDLPIDQSFQS
jgi:hypothetical protein